MRGRGTPAQLDALFSELTELRPDEANKVVGGGPVASPCHGAYADG